MSRTAAVLCVLALCVSIASGLDIGDKAPPLTIAKWVKGDAVNPATPDGKTTYVVEFWATWCPPCRQSIPHLSDVQAHFKDKGVVVVGISTEDTATVEPFVAKQQKMDYHVAVDDNKKTSNVWMAGVDGIPHAFIVDKKGVVVWKGHPMAGLDGALEQVLTGTYDADTAKKVADKREELQKALQSRDLDKILTAVDEMIQVEPTVYQHYDLKLKVLSFKKDYGEIAKTRHQAMQVFLQAKAHGPLNNMAWAMATDSTLHMRDLKLALTCAEEAVKLTGRKISADLDTLARVYYAIGMLDKAVAVQKEAVAVATDDDKQRSANVLKYYETTKALRTEIEGAGK